jgi:hypothetical protein
MLIYYGDSMAIFDNNHTLSPYQANTMSVVLNVSAVYIYMCKNGSAVHMYMCKVAEPYPSHTLTDMLDAFTRMDDVLLTKDIL